MRNSQTVNQSENFPVSDQKDPMPQNDKYGNLLVFVQLLEIGVNTVKWNTAIV